MTSQDVLVEIRSLKTDLNDYADRMVRLRYDDLKTAFVEQMRAAVGEEGRRTFTSEASDLRDSSACPHRTACIGKLEEAVEAAATRFKMNDFAEAERILDEVEGLIAGDCTPCLDGDCSGHAAETLRRVRAVLKVYEGLASTLDKKGAVPAPEQMAGEPTPEDYEAVLDPLANAWRVRSLQVLRGGERSLSELGRTMKLKTGHLQFHLRSLVAAGYVAQDRRKHRYRITERGAVALSCAEEMVAKVRPPVLTDQKGGMAGEEVGPNAL